MLRRLDILLYATVCVWQSYTEEVMSSIFWIIFILSTVLSCSKCSVFRVRKAYKVLILMLIPDAITDTLCKYQFWCIVLFLILDTDAGNPAFILILIPDTYIHTNTLSWYWCCYIILILMLDTDTDIYIDSWWWYWYWCLIVLAILGTDTYFQNLIPRPHTTFLCWVKLISTMQRSSKQEIMLRFNVMTIL